MEGRTVQINEEVYAGSDSMTIKGTKISSFTRTPRLVDVTRDVSLKRFMAPTKEAVDDKKHLDRHAKDLRRANKQYDAWTKREDHMEKAIERQKLIRKGVKQATKADAEYCEPVKMETLQG